MSYPTHTKAIICYIEAHIKDAKIGDAELEKRIGFSIAHIRDFFRRDTGYPLAKYIRMRKIKCSATELVNTNKTILEIAYSYGFSNPETYTRAFQKIVGVTPSAFRRQAPKVGKEYLTAGVYGIGILSGQELNGQKRGGQDPSIRERSKQELKDGSGHKKDVDQNNESTILYGVPRAAHGMYGGNTPYPICLKACSEYLGEHVDYPFIMVGSAAAFRMVWNHEMWDLSNVDLFHALNETNEVYRLGAEALGREFSFLERTAHTTKEEFISFIKKHIDEGYPCIALGIIGPPEPCIITGYRNYGEELLGWNFFQNDPEFATVMDTDESGYFISRDWWGNSDTQAVMCMGAAIKERLTTKEILAVGIRVLEGRKVGCYSKGLKAYEAWERALENVDTKTESYACLFEKMLCHNDAVNCLTDGRKSAASFFAKQAKESSEHRSDYKMIAKAFDQCVKEMEAMRALYGNPPDINGMLDALADSDIRKKTCERIRYACKADAKALAVMKKVISEQGAMS